MEETDVTRPAPTDAVGSGEKSESLVTVLVALVANAIIAAVKSVVAAITGSASMVAEAAHSWADTGNEVFLMIAERRAGTSPDESHPYGYGRAAYVWSMIAAFGLFAAGAAVSVWHGIDSWAVETEEADYFWGYIVLAVSFVLEGVSFLRARSQVRQGAQERGLSGLQYLDKTSDPTLRAVFVEDAAALIGLAVAGVGMYLHQVTGDGRWDAGGSILVGVVLGCVAIFLLKRNMAFLIGEVADPEVRDHVLGWLLERPEVTSVAYLHLEYVGPGKVLLVGAVDLEGNEREDQVATMLQRLEDDLMAHPGVTHAVLSLASPGQRPLRRLGGASRTSHT